MLHKDRENFEQVILKVSEDTGIDASIIEKDYYVTLFLKRIVEVLPNIIFKGGTSLSKCYKLDDKLKALAKEVYIEREPHEQCRSAKPWVEMNKLLQEIIDVEAYKKDYEDITMKMLFEKIDYETAASKLQQVVAHGLFE